MDWNSDGRKDLIVGDTDGYIWIFLNTGTDADPVLAPGFKLRVNGQDFKPAGGRAKPWVVDWNKDGKQDLVVGVENGEVLLLLNTGTAKEPAFAAAAPLKAGNKVLKCDMRVSPVVWDWNRDGKRDLLCADESGKVTFFENIGTDAEPRFKEGIPIQARGWPIAPPAASAAKGDIDGDGRDEILDLRPDGTIEVYGSRSQVVLSSSTRQRSFVKVDGLSFRVERQKATISTVLWNDDKKADLLVGLEDGRVLLLLSQCTKENWIFARPIELKDGDKPLQAGRLPYLSAEDWNHDGKKDLVCCSADGTAYWFMNQGTDTAPVFNGRQVAEKDFSPIDGGYRSALAVADWNHDGKPDLLYGVTASADRRGYLYLYLAE